LFSENDDTCEWREDQHGADYGSLSLCIPSDISITSHSCALRSLLVVLHHRPFSLETGEMIPVIVKATKQN
jgi:hypothetical protein